MRSENAHHQRKDANKENICAGTAMRTLVSGLTVNQDALMLDSLALSATISYRYEFIFVDSTS